MPRRMAFKAMFAALYVAGICDAAVVPRVPYHLNQRQSNSTSNSTTSNSTRKAGLGWPNGNSVDIRPFTNTSKISWYYTWSALPISDPQENIALEFVPMLWGNNSVSEFQSTINETIRAANSSKGYNNVSAILGMNEPDQAGQSNLTPAEGVSLWLANIEPFHESGLRLGSPAVTSSPAGKVWLQDFFTGCNGSCTVDFVALHWYGTDADSFIALINDYWSTFNRTLWVTEWACQNFVNLSAQCTEADVVDFMNKTQMFLDESDFVERYAWFGAMKDMQGVNQDDALMDSSGAITSLGEQYVNDEPLESTAMPSNATA